VPVLFACACELFQTPGFGDTVDFDHIRRHYYQVHRDINAAGSTPTVASSSAAGPWCGRAARATSAQRGLAGGAHATSSLSRWRSAPVLLGWRAERPARSRRGPFGRITT